MFFVSGVFSAFGVSFALSFTNGLIIRSWPHLFSLFRVALVFLTALQWQSAAPGVLARTPDWKQWEQAFKRAEVDWESSSQQDAHSAGAERAGQVSAGAEGELTAPVALSEPPERSEDDARNKFLATTSTDPGVPAGPGGTSGPEDGNTIMSADQNHPPVSRVLFPVTDWGQKLLTVYHVTRQESASAILGSAFRFPSLEQSVTKNLRLGAGVYFGRDLEFCYEEVLHGWLDGTYDGMIKTNSTENVAEIQRGLTALEVEVRLGRSLSFGNWSSVGSPHGGVGLYKKSENHYR